MLCEYVRLVVLAGAGESQEPRELDVHSQCQYRALPTRWRADTQAEETTTTVCGGGRLRVQAQHTRANTSKQRQCGRQPAALPKQPPRTPAAPATSSAAARTEPRALHNPRSGRYEWPSKACKHHSRKSTTIFTKLQTDPHGPAEFGIAYTNMSEQTRCLGAPRRNQWITQQHKCQRTPTNAQRMTTNDGLGLH